MSRERADPAAEPVAAEPAAAEPSAPATPTSVAEVLDRLDRGWQAFRALVGRLPRERVDEPIGDGWTYKQMLAHVGHWHDSATNGLLGFSKTGQPQTLTEPMDAVNARVARVAIGRTSGEVVGALDASFARLRRQVALLADAQLQEHDGWAATLIADNSYDHYAEHAADLQAPGLSSNP